MHPSAASPDYASPAGVGYVTDPTALAAGPHTFTIEASDGLESVQLPPVGSAKPNIDGIIVYNIPQLLVPNPAGPDDGTLSPRSGPLSQTFTYQVMYKHLDGTAPQSVTVFIDGQPFAMTKL